ncbi:MAG TPA: tRNA pseudouridine(55) synthase TruB [Candidatus Limnocylindrales bacterium]|nr:tRNA pseudouridine(55) synthase TruB [Candidatus Limnocylindrales bacterium]
MTRSGVLNIDKPLGVTSHDVVTQVRRTLGESRVGHAGTLDPLATGVLIVCVGPAVRLSEFLMASSKTYVADVHLGRTTTTDDSEGQITAELPVDGLDAAQLTAALPAFTGEIEQIPPDYSAVKQGGKKLYQLARQGRTVEAAPRRVRIDSLRLLAWTPPVARIEMVCGPGTYVRSLARDLGQTLGVGGSLAGLRRTVSGVFRAEEGVAAAALSDAEALAAALMPLRQALAGWPVVALDAAALNDVLHGRRVQAAPLPPGTLALGVTETGDVAALLRAVADGWQPERVLVS